jgi:hypothetical protein
MRRAKKKKYKKKGGDITPNPEDTVENNKVKKGTHKSKAPGTDEDHEGYPVEGLMK